MAHEFVHLHVHSEMSLLDGLGKMGDLVETARAAGAPALALTDHGTMFGAVDFYTKTREAGVKPIIGCEVYVADRPLIEPPTSSSRAYHLVLLAQDEVGYRNLIRLTTEAHLRGFYRKPRVDDALLQQHSEGLVCLSACASSEIARLILDGDLPAAEQRADWFRQAFPGRYYLELQDHGLDVQQTINDGIMHLSRRLDLPIVATNDVHYVRRQEARAHEILLCIQTQTLLSDPKRMRLETDEFYLKSSQEMLAAFRDYPEAIANTLEIAERCNLELTFGRPQLPEFTPPAGLSSEAYLRRLCEEGLQERYGENSTLVRNRLEYELSVILDTGFTDYFLLVFDVIRFARMRGIAVGPGRGSAAGSIVAYVLHITNVDPIRHGLSFERFLNPERVTMPDMDLDFADDRRDEVINYVTEKYGRERVAQIITFGTLKPRAAVRDVGRVLGMPYGDVDRVAKLVPPMTNSLDAAKSEVPELQQLADGDRSMGSLLDTVQVLEGVARHASTHAAGVVISKEPLASHVPLYKVPKNEQVTTQYSMSSIEKIGLLKMDFLGLRTLTILQRACGFIAQSAGEQLSADEIPVDDPAAYELLATGDTFGVFQVDGERMRALLRELHPTEFNHVVAIIALYRPGPMEHIPEYVRRKNGLERVEYAHPAMEEVLGETYGTIVYQDQVMRLAVEIAGYTMGEADLVRRAMAKKKREDLARHREEFIRRADERGTRREVAEELFNRIEPFAGYAFNKAHAAAYAVVTCQTAYLKAKYPREYMAGLLSAECENADRVTAALAECRRLEIPILPPDVNHSGADFTLEGEGIRFGLSAVKHLGSSAIDSILAVRAERPFESLSDFCQRIDWSVVNKRALESLGKCGALESFGVERGRLVAGLDRLVGFGTQMHRAASQGQSSLFGETDAVAPDLHLPLDTPATPEQKLSWERELLGTMLSPHPLTEAEKTFEEHGILAVGQVGDEYDQRRVRVGGVARGIRSFSTKDGKPMATLRISDLQMDLEAVVFSRAFEKLQSKLNEDVVTVVEGKVDGRDGKLRLVAEMMYSVEEARTLPPIRNGNGNGGGVERNGHAEPPSRALPAARVRIEVIRTGDRASDLDRVVDIYRLLQAYPGPDDVDLVVRHGQRWSSIPLPSRKTRWCPELERELRRRLPESQISADVAEAAPRPGVASA